MIVLFGTTTRHRVTTQHGQFYCPNCLRNTTFAGLRRRKYFHLFYVPVLRLEDAPGGVRCSGCGTDFDVHPHDAAPMTVGATWACPQCGREWPETSIRCAVCRVTPDGTPRP